MKLMHKKLNRSQFLRLATGAAVALAMPNGIVRAAEAAAGAAMGDPAYYGGLRVGMHTYTLRNFTFDRAVEITKGLGLKYIGFNPRHTPFNATPEQLRAFREQVAAAGMELMALGVVAFGPKDPERRKIFEMARDGGFKTISTSAPRETLAELQPLVEEFGIRLAVHNHGPSDYWSTPEKLMETLKDLHPGIGACVDIGHYKRAGVEPHHALRLLGARVLDVHLKDVDKAEESGKSVVMGTGVIDVKEALRVLLEIKFTGHTAIEYEAEPANPVPAIEKSLEYVRECLKGLA